MHWTCALCGEGYTYGSGQRLDQANQTLMLLYWSRLASSNSRSAWQPQLGCSLPHPGSWTPASGRSVPVPDSPAVQHTHTFTLQLAAYKYSKWSDLHWSVLGLRGAFLKQFFTQFRSSVFYKEYYNLGGKDISHNIKKKKWKAPC
jgi:hypothetical protein